MSTVFQIITNYFSLVYIGFLSPNKLTHSRLTDFQMPKKLEHLENKYWLWRGLDIQPYSWIT